MLEQIVSVSGRRFELKSADERQVMTICQRLGVPDIVARLLVQRGITTEEAESFLKPTLREFLPDPFHLKGMEQAVTRTLSAIQNKEGIAIFGDYDVDGATSSALLVRYFRALGIEPIIYIPDRMKEGYGPNTTALLKLKEQGATLVITVDCGTLAFEPLKAAKLVGQDVIVLDHHKGEPEMPECAALVNPNRFDESSPHGQLAAVGVTFLFLVALGKRLKEQNIKTPDLLRMLDIVALGTICDVVPLTGVNRAMVAQGLKVMAQRENVGIAALMDAARLDERPGTYHAGFIIGPRINAGGRVGESDLGVKILTTDDALYAAELAQRLSRYNEERKAIEAGVLEEATRQAEALPASDLAIVVASGNWHPGVIGIVAGRLKDMFGKPTAVIAISGGVGKASARSISGIDIGAAVIAAHQSGVLLGGGGHAMAAGFSLAENAVASLREFFNRWMAPHLAAMPKERRLLLDAGLTVKGVAPSLVHAIEALGPFGAGNPQPRFLLERVKVVRSDIVGGDHVRAILADEVGSGSLKAVAFRSVQNDIGKTLLGSKGRPLHVAGSLKLNYWQGNETAEFTIEDVALV